MMCQRNDFDLLVTDPIDKTKRKVGKEIPTCPVNIPRPTLRRFSYPFHTDIDFRCKGAGSDWTTLRVPLHSSLNLSNRSRMKANPDVWHQYAS
jgi:hypothetical protein